MVNIKTVMDNCCICGKDLPNRYAISGKCEEESCQNPFCSLHWNRGNHRCSEHGYQEINSKIIEETAMSDNEDKQAQKKVDPEKAKAAMKEAFKLVKKLGAGAAGLLKKLKKDRSPQAMIETLDGHFSINQARREEVSGKVERLYNEIAAKKKAYKSAAKAKQRIIEAELKSLLSIYKTTERELGILLDNEKNLSLIKGRLNEIVAYGMAGVSEIMIDDVIDNIEDAVSDAESISDATRDLEKAGKRRDRESDTEDLWGELDAFGEEEEPTTATDQVSLDDFEETPEPEEKKPEPEKEI